jgi:3-hydroxy-9,10-secoandrosta-1,3,5(10)-triene-9,17-dione monooxygenase
MALELERFYSANRHCGVTHAEAIYHYPLLPGLLVMLAAVAVGSAEGALALARRRLSETAPWGLKRIDRATSRVRWAEAAQDIRCAQLLFEDMCRYTQARCAAGAEWSLIEQGQLDLDLSTTTHLCKNAVAALLDGCGSSTFQLADPLQRHLRDLNVLGSHLGNDRDVVIERGARFVLGLGQLPTDPFAPRRSNPVP